MMDVAGVYNSIVRSGQRWAAERDDRGWIVVDDDSEVAFVGDGEGAEDTAKLIAASRNLFITALRSDPVDEPYDPTNQEQWAGFTSTKDKDLFDSTLKDQTTVLEGSPDTYTTAEDLP